MNLPPQSDPPLHVSGQVFTVRLQRAAQLSALGVQLRGLEVVSWAHFGCGKMLDVPGKPGGSYGKNMLFLERVEMWNQWG